MEQILQKLARIREDAEKALNELPIDAAKLAVQRQGLENTLREIERLTDEIAERVREKMKP